MLVFSQSSGSILVSINFKFLENSCEGWLYLACYFWNSIIYIYIYYIPYRSNKYYT
jgi:hypothetical protein